MAVTSFRQRTSALSAGKDQVKSLESKTMPRTVPTLELTNAFSLLGQIGASPTPIMEQSLRKTSENLSQKREAAGATMGKSSKHLCSHLSGIPEMTLAKVDCLVCQS